MRLDLRKTVEVDWFCQNRDCGWSVTLSLPDREEINPRCVCGWPLKRGNPPLASHYLEFLHNEQTLEKTGHTRKE